MTAALFLICRARYTGLKSARSAPKDGAGTMEKTISPKISSGIATRNNLMVEPVANLAGNDRSRTDILHEYFVPPENFSTICQRRVKRSFLPRC